MPNIVFSYFLVYNIFISCLIKNFSKFLGNKYFMANSGANNLPLSTQTLQTPPKILCKVCLRLFNSERGLLLHRKSISKYNRPKEHIDILPSQTIKEFQEICVYHIYKKLSKNYI